MDASVPKMMLQQKHHSCEDPIIQFQARIEYLEEENYILRLYSQIDKNVRIILEDSEKQENIKKTHVFDLTTNRFIEFLLTQVCPDCVPRNKLILSEKEGISMSEKRYQLIESFYSFLNQSQKEKGRPEIDTLIANYQ